MFSMFMKTAEMKLEIFNAMPWDGDMKFAKAMQFFHLRYQKPIVLHVGSFIEHSNVITLQVR